MSYKFEICEYCIIAGQCNSYGPPPCSKLDEEKMKSTNKVMVPCPKFVAEGCCHGSPWHASCTDTPCIVAQLKSELKNDQNN